MGVRPLYPSSHLNSSYSWMFKLMSYLENSFLLAFGLHLNILCVIAQLLLIRQDLMDSPSYVLLTASLTSSPLRHASIRLTNDHITNQTNEDSPNISPIRRTACHWRDRCPRERHTGRAVPRTGSPSFYLLDGS